MAIGDGCAGASGGQGQGARDDSLVSCQGKGGGSGPVDYLLGRERNQEGATVLQGSPEEVRELIDATPFAKEIPVRCSVVRGKELPPGGCEKVGEHERVRMPGLEKNQYSILWVEHQDKDGFS